MAMRWKILALLFAIRVTMALQYQATAALSPFIMEEFGVQLADIGLLIGLYLSPGIVIALPGGALGRYLGDKKAVAVGMLLMFSGALIIAMVPNWNGQIGGRLLAGIGGIILNVLMTKMVTDWFRNDGLATAMGIFVNSWPVGIAIALLVLPPLAESVGLATASSLIALIILAGLLALMISYQEPETVRSSISTGVTRLDWAALTGLMMAGGIWALYNGALSMVFSFGPTLLIEKGWSVTTASFTTSTTLWIVALSVPAGGFLADWLGRRDLVLMLGLSSFAILMFAIQMEINLVVLFIMLGIVGGIAAGPVMSMPADVLSPANRAFGMGLFFTIYYVANFVAPIGAGYLSEKSGSTESAFQLGGVLLLVCIGCLAIFKAITTGSRALAERG